MNRRFYVAVALLGTQLLCTRPLETSGVTETGTVVTGKLVTQTGALASASAVKLVPTDYDPLKDARVTVYADTSNDSGAYLFQDIPPGMYTLQAVNLKARTRAMISVIDVSKDSEMVPDDTLQTPGAIKIALSDIFDTTNGYVYIPGTFNFARLQGAGGYVVLDSVPAGTIASVLFNSSSSSGGPQTVRSAVVVPPGGIAVVSNAAWQYSKTIQLNTGKSGAQITGNVYGFPLLIRLTDKNFDFSGAKINGDDIRFTKKDNTPMAHQIERWDAVGGRAEIWVKADTILGNDSAQSIVIYWGNPNAASASNGAAVFDTANGYQGVWHLNGAAGGLENDATIHHYNATPSGKVLPVDTAGIIGTAKRFDGASGFFDMKNTANSGMNFSYKGQYTLSAWVNADTLDSAFQALVYKGTYQYGLQIRPEHVWEFNEYKDSSYWEGVRYPAIAHVWKHVVSVRSGAQELLYVDGTLVSTTVINTPRQFGIVGRSTASDVQLGHSIDGDEGGRYFKGALDEVCVSGVSRSADWIKLCYMNQRSDDKVVIFK